MSSKYQRETGSNVDPDAVDESAPLDEVEGAEDVSDPVADLGQAEELDEDSEEPHEVRRDGSVAAFASDQARETAVNQEGYVRETGVDKNGSEK